MNRLNFLIDSVKATYHKQAIAFIVFLSLLSWIISSTNGFATAYNDAMSHLNLSRLVIDNLEPGLSQLGGVWLPMNHILSLPLIWNDWAWHSGFAGSIVSMISYVGSAIFLYKLIKVITSSTIASFLGALSFAINLNILYLQTTPLTESLYIFLFILSSFLFIKYIKTDNINYLLLLGFAGFLQVLTRYDGWFVVTIELILLLYRELMYKKRTIHETVAKAILFGAPIAFGVFLWIAWNTLIFNDPFYFAFGPYSARAQQAALEQSTSLITKGNLFVSVTAYILSMIQNIGILVLLLSLAGIEILIFKTKWLGEWMNSMKNKLLILGILLSPVIFNILALYLGFSILNLPDLKWNPSQDPSGQWFNVRYGILGLPFVAVFVGIFASWRKLAAILALEVIILQAVLMVPQGIITITDGVHGASSYVNHDVSDYLRDNVQKDEKVLLSTSHFNAIAFKSGLHLNQLIHEGVSKQWHYAIVTPEQYAQWLIMSNGNIREAVYTSLVINQKERFLQNYRLVYKGEHAYVYRLKKNYQFKI